MHAGSVTISSAEPDQNVPSLSCATAMMFCESPSRMRVDTQARPERGLRWNVPMLGCGLRSLKTAIALTKSFSVIGLSTVTTSGTEFPFSTSGGMSIVTRPFVIVAYSKGLPDVLELLVTRPAAAARVAAVESLAGASNGSPLADRFRSTYELLVAGFPLDGCRPGTGQELDDLRRDVRLEWWRRHAAAVSVPIFTLVTAPRRERVSPLMRPAYLTLARLEPRNDGNLVWYDQIPPGSRLLGYLDADHWGVATPYTEQIPIAGPFFADSVPRPSIIEAALEVVSTSLPSGAW